ncbi:MAG: DUF502 domain-containing protein [Parachlamydiales bacterium]|nr:DUF502 domain-containing protein [Parachlamydiales bacterium]
MKKFFVTGIVILFPLVVTIAILSFIVNFLTRPFGDIVTDILQATNMQQHFSADVTHFISQILVLVSMFVGIVLLGVLIQHFFFQKLIKLTDSVFGRIPFVKKIYKAMHEITKTLMASKKKAFKQVVMVPFPNDSVYALGLITGNGSMSSQLKDELVSVFVPTTPNPTSGYIVMFKKEQVKYLDMNVEDALKYIVSCGVVTPDPVITKPVRNPT